MNKNRRPHPSGRPIRRIDKRMLGFTRRPFDEPLSPGLRKVHQTANAIGFTAELFSSDGETIVDGSKK